MTSQSSADSDIATRLNAQGRAAFEGNQTAEAERCFLQALAAAPSNAETHFNLSGVCKFEGRLEEAVQHARQAVACPNTNARIHEHLLFLLNYLPQASGTEIFREHELWGRLYGSPAQAPAAHTNNPDPQRRLRIGYLSPDFRLHSAAFFLEPLLAGHDRGAVEVFAYAEVRRPDQVTARLKALCQDWRDTTALNDAQLVEQIRKDEIDILVDLAGHSAGNRLLALAAKPAPIQATYLGYPNTTGLRAVDYRLTDIWADPPAHDGFYTEKLARLPAGFLCYSPPLEAPPVTPPPAARKGFVTFGSFNMAYKINTEVVRAWSRILRALPNAQLILKSYGFSFAGLRRRYAEMFQKEGLGPERVHIHGSEPNRATHLGLYGEIDIGLDTFPYNGTTTTCEALWMGVPVLALAGGVHAARVGVSLLTQLGLDRFAANSLEEYVQSAVSVAQDLPQLAALRARLRGTMQTAPLCDGKRFARNVEHSFREMWRRWCSEQPGSAKSMSFPKAAQNPPNHSAEQRSGADSLSANTQPAEQPNAVPFSASNLPTRGRAVEAALLSDAFGRLGRREDATYYAQTGLLCLDRGLFDGGLPEELLARWQAPSLEGTLLRECLCFSTTSSCLDAPRSLEWLLRWAKHEPNNAEAFLRFGLLSAHVARAANKPVPATALEALRHAHRENPSERSALALALAEGQPAEAALTVDGTRIFLQPDLTALATFTLLEQGDWHEEEIDLFRAIIQPGDAVLDAFAGAGAHTLSAARRVGPRGRVLACEPDAAQAALLSRSAAPFASVVTAKHAPATTLLQEINQAGGAFDIVNLSAQGKEVELLTALAPLFSRKMPILFCDGGGTPGAQRQVLAQLEALGCLAFSYSAFGKVLRRCSGTWERPGRLFALPPESLPRVDGRAEFL